MSNFFERSMNTSCRIHREDFKKELQREKFYFSEKEGGRRRTCGKFNILHDLLRYATVSFLSNPGESKHMGDYFHAAGIGWPPLGH